MNATRIDVTRVPEPQVLVGDIGGTHARLALVTRGAADWRRTYLCADFPGVLQAIESYLAEIGTRSRPTRVALAVAGPVIDGCIAFTNNGWRISESELLGAGFEKARLVNDFAALAMALPYVGPNELNWLGGPREPRPHGTVAVLGPGTGFGIAALAREGGQSTVVTTEGGHVSFAPTDAVEMEVLRYLSKQFERVSVERLLSGPGLANLHGALGAIAGSKTPVLDPAEITRRARAGEAGCLETVNRFCSILGSVAGDAALSFGAQGGVYITGGVAEKLADLIAASDFRQRFEAKGRFADYQRAIPTWLLASTDAAFVGAAQAMLG